jgi:hypothetical protein
MDHDRRTFVALLAGAAVAELLVFIWLAAIGRPAFLASVWTPDTASYLGLAQHLAETHELVATTRTLGYPLFAAPAYVIGGARHGPYVVIAMQLLLNLCLLWLGWRLLERLAPDATRLRIGAAIFLFVGGIGLATVLMSDFLAALGFVVFLYGFLFWRTWRGALFTAIALTLATLTRPTFTLVPLLLPVAAYLVRHVTSRIPPVHVLLFAAASIAATSVSFVYQYRFNGYVGASPILIYPIQEMLYFGVVRPTTSQDYASFRQDFTEQIAIRAGRPFGTMSLAERETYAKQLFREALIAHPLSIGRVVTTNAVKYLFAPVESLIARLANEFILPATYGRYVRPLITVVCLPVFLLSIVPPIAYGRSYRMYYALMMLFLVYIIGLSAIGFGSGERIRFPMLTFMAPVAVWNTRTVVEHLRARFSASDGHRRRWRDCFSKAWLA